MYPEQLNNEHIGDGVFLYGLQGTKFYKEIEKSEAMTKEDTTWKPDNKIESFDEFAGLTDFERTLADICIGWIGKEIGWKQYIKDNANVLLRIAFEKFNSVQDVPFEQKPAFLDLETKEVDIEKEVINWWNAYYSSKAYTFEGYTGHYLENSTLIKIAKHFFELGQLNARKKE